MMIQTARSSVRSLNKKRCLTHLGRGAWAPLPASTYGEQMNIRMKAAVLASIALPHSEES